MTYNDLCGERVSALGFGAMRLPLREDKAIDSVQVDEMIKYAVEHGVNYFDTAWPYHSGMSEVVLSESLHRFPRDKYFLADKYPGHQIADEYIPSEIFEAQLKKCRTSYFDFYLLHNVYENSFDVYTDPKWKIIDYFVKQKEKGRIKHLGFSSHARPETLRRFLEYCGDKMEFCQIQLNYVDWSLQNAKEKIEILNEYNIPVVVMEPLRGGRLARLTDEESARLKEKRPEESNASWSFRWLKSIPSVKVTLSGMSSLEQMMDNVKTYSKGRKLTKTEEKILYEIADGMKNSVPCTGCRYCTDKCPKKIDIPLMMRLYNDIKFQASFTTGMQFDSIPLEKQPSSCAGCGECAKMCPQKIAIPEVMKDLAERVSKIPKWADICRERAAASRR